MNEKERDIGIITILRGVAALMVLFFHLFCLSNGYFSNNLLQSIFWFGKYGVEFFFVISGFVICYSMLKGGYAIQDFWVFLKKRIIRIEPPYLVLLFLTILYRFLRVKVGIATSNFELPTLNQIMLHIGYLIPFTEERWLSIVFWTLGVEFQFYLLISLLFAGLNNKWWVRSLIVIMLLAAGLSSKNENFIFHWIPIFLAGIFLALYKLDKICKRQFIGYCVIFFSVIYYKLGWAVFLFSIIPFIIIYFEPIIHNKVFNFFGNISYSVYLTHTLVIFPIISFGIKFFAKSISERIFVGLAALFAAIMVSSLLHFLVELPVKNLAARFSYKVK